MDKLPRVGDVWRKRYHSLALAQPGRLNHMPYMPFPPSWPKYLPKDMLGNWLETYAWAMECNVWTGTTLVEGSTTRRRPLERASASRRRLRARAASAPPRLRERHRRRAQEGRRRPASTTSRARCCIRTATPKASRWRGKNALVLGAGTSGHDIAQDLHGHGANVKLIQRGSITVASVDAAGINHGVYYNEGLPLRIAT